MTTLIVFSHLRWSFVYQRPQQLLTRISRSHPVVYIEEPVHTDGPSELKCARTLPNLTVLVPHTAADAAGFHDDQLPVLQPLIAEYLARERIADYLVWIYTPMALPLIAALRPRAVVYDCMDELSAFDHAPRQLPQRENALFGRADLVIAGGLSLFEAKRTRHSNVHLLPSSVDSHHFAPGNLDASSAQHRAVADIQGGIAQPRLGFFGVIDERMDMALIDTLARCHPAWQIVMVGPVVKIDPASLCRLANVHWAGMQPYELLPYFLAGWDICLMPFAINQATRFISPTKTLEYFAGERPVVSTPVRDVVRLYGEAVDVGAGAEFVRACERCLCRAEADQADRLKSMRRLVAQSSWDVSALRVQALIEETLGRDPNGDATPAVASTGSRPPAVRALADCRTATGVRSGAG